MQNLVTCQTRTMSLSVIMNVVTHYKVLDLNITFTYH